MSAPSDASLLEEWSARGSEDAFAILSRRYAGLLYHAAMRRTGSKDLAGEATQNSLLVLARKASRLGKHPNLAGWLHRTVSYEAAKLARRERRHQARMKRCHFHRESGDGEASWQAVVPLLDQALDSLSEKDRQVIFLKYFDGMSFEQMARQFGGEAAAWRQRGSRAVEKLRISIAKRGVALSGSSLATGLGTTLSQAAPPPVLAAVSTSPAAGAAALSWPSLAAHTLHLMKFHPATWVVASLMLATVPLSLQALAISLARTRVASLESFLAGTPPAPAAFAGKPLPAGPGGNRQQVLALADKIAEGDEGSRVATFQAKGTIERMSEQELEQALADAVTLGMSPEKRHDLVGRLFFHYADSRKPKVPVEKVMRTAAMLHDRLGIKGQEMVWSWAGARMMEWMKTDPAAAMAWFQAEKASGRLDSTRLYLSFSGSIYTGLREKNPGEAEAFYRTLNEDERMSVLNFYGQTRKPEEFVDMAAKFEDPEKRQTSLLRLFQYATKQKPAAEVREWLDRSGANGREAVDLLAIAAEGDPYRPDGGVRFHAGMRTPQIAERIEWLRDPAMGDHGPAAIGAFLAGTMKSAPEQTREALDAEWDKHPEEAMLASYISRAGATAAGAADALERAGDITDLTLRGQVVADLLKGSGARELLKTMRKEGITDEDLEALGLPSELFR